MPEAERVQNIFSAQAKDFSSDNFSICRITLTNFRNYCALRLSLDRRPVVLTGPNGSGKTNFLEAISLLVPGRGLRHGALSDLQNRGTNDPWAVAIDLQTPDGPLSIGTGRDNAVNDSDGERRLVHVDGKPTRSQALLAEHIAMAWITPDMDRLLSEGASARRKFLDRLACSFDPAHGGRVLAYEKALRERLRLLRENTNDAAWLSALENEMAQAAVALAATRRHMIDRLCAAICIGGGSFPRPDVAVRGTAEDLLDDKPALLVEDALRDAFRRTRSDDALRGICTIGAHRSDLKVIHQRKNCPAEICSTGEQKALMIALMLAYVRLLAEERRMPPLFLLDDIVAHLDDERRNDLFDEALSLGSQVWFTGTDNSSFAPLAQKAQRFWIENGSVV